MRYFTVILILCVNYGMTNFEMLRKLAEETTVLLALEKLNNRLFKVLIFS